MTLKRWLSFLFLMFFILPIMAQEQSKTDISTRDVYRATNKLSYTLKQISDAMGIEHLARKPIGVKDVSTREIYFQAATLYTKTSRLMFEFTHEETKNIVIMNVDANSSDVLSLLQLSEKNLLVVTDKLDIPAFDLNAVSGENKTPTQVFQTIVELNRKANALLDFRFSPSNVHQKITEAIAIAAAVIESQKGLESVFYPHAIERNIRPQDVYLKMVTMYDAMRPIMKKFGKQCLVLEEYEKQRSQVLPSDVYDLAVMVVSQLRYMHSLIPSAKKIKNSYYPGKVIPSDVYQRLSILEQQMMEIMKISNLTSLNRNSPVIKIAK